MHVVTLSYDLTPDEDTLVRWADELEQSDASVAYIPGHGVDVTIWIDGFDVIKAPAVAVDYVDRVVGAAPIAAEAVSQAEYERRADAPTLPRLVSAPEVAEILGDISRQRVHQLRALTAFPAPLLELRTGPIWDARAIERFEREWERKPGRPAKEQGETNGDAEAAEAGRTVVRRAPRSARKVRARSAASGKFVKKAAAAKSSRKVV